MGFQCVPQIMGLVRGDGERKDGKGQAKHRANVAAMVHEAFEIKDQEDGHAIPIRKSASETYDRSRTRNNRYAGFRTADDVVAALEEEADKQRVEVRVKDKETGETVIRKRALPANTVLGAAVIFNPPSEVAKDWPPEKYGKFFRDCEEVMAQMPCGKFDKNGEITGTKYYLFRRENILASAEHWDEGAPLYPPVFTGHKHDFYKPEGEDGKYYGKFIDAYFLSYVNRNFARMMRERGWDVDDADCTDWERFSTDKEYRSKRRTKIRTGGKSVNGYIADKKRKDAEETLTEAQELLDQTAALRREAEAEAQEKRMIAQAGVELMNELKSGIQNEITELAKNRDSIRAEAKAAEEDRDTARREAADARQAQMIAQMSVAVLDDAKASMQNDIQVLEQVRAKAREDLRTAKTEAAAAQADRDAARKEASELRRNAVARAEQEAQATRARLEAEAREYWKNWLDKKKKWAEDTANKIIEDAKARAAELIAVAAEAAKDEYAYFIQWMGAPHRTYTSGKHKGKTFLQAARDDRQEEIRRKRVAMIRNAGKGQLPGPGHSAPEK